MTADEAHSWLFTMQWLLSDEGQPQLAYEVSDVTLRVRELNAAERAWLADYFMPRGRRGRVKKVLYPGYDARVYALVATILRAIE